MGCLPQGSLEFLRGLGLNCASTFGQAPISGESHHRPVNPDPREPDRAGGGPEGNPERREVIVDREGSPNDTGG